MNPAEPARTPIVCGFDGTLAEGNVQGERRASEVGKRLWEPLTQRFAGRRHALSHMVTSCGETFESAAQYAGASREELFAVSHELGFAVLQEIADDFGSLPPPEPQWNAVWAATEWIEDQL